MSVPVAPDRSDSAGSLEAELLAPEEAIARYGNAWRDLALVTDKATVFMYPAIFQGWCEVLSHDVETAVIVVRDNRSLRGVMPVMVARVWRGPKFVPRIDYAPSERRFAPGGVRPFPVRQVSSVVSWLATSIRPTLLCNGCDHPATTAAIARVIASLGQMDEFVLPACEGDQTSDWLAALRGVGFAPWVHRLERRVLAIENVRPFVAIVAEQNKKFRQNVRRAHARADKEGITVSLWEGYEDIAPRLAAFARLASLSWKQSGKPGVPITIPYVGKQRRFFECVLAQRNSGIVPVLAMASVAGDPIAACLSARHGSTLTTLLLFRDGRFPEASPGLLVIESLIDWAASSGLRRIDLNATQDWLRYLSDTSHTLANVVAFGPTLRGQAYCRMASAFRLWRGEAVS